MIAEGQTILFRFPQTDQVGYFSRDTHKTETFFLDTRCIIPRLQFCIYRLVNPEMETMSQSIFFISNQDINPIIKSINFPLYQRGIKGDFQISLPLEPLTSNLVT